MNMRIKRTPLKAIRMNYECECGGEMKEYKTADGSNVVTGNNPTKYLHVCNKCGKRQYLDGKFPRIEYME